MNGNILRLMFVYTTSDVHLTQGLNFEIYLSNFCEIATYSGLKEIMFLMTNDNLFDYQIFVHREIF
jgi:hypothetical protein